TALRVPHILERVPIPLWSVADVALLQRLHPVAPAGPKQRLADLAFQDVLPLVGVWVPVQLSECAGIEVEYGARNGLGDRKLGRIDQPQLAALVVDSRRVGQEPVLVRPGRRVVARKWDGSRLGRQRAASEIHLGSWEPLKRRFRHAEVFREQRLW